VILKRVKKRPVQDPCKTARLNRVENASKTKILRCTNLLEFSFKSGCKKPYFIGD
jgi:hypothetical protein